MRLQVIPKPAITFLFFAALFLSSSMVPAFADNSKATHTFAIGTNDFLLDGKSFSNPLR